ncbi:MAG: type II toxin-antitoxin system VapC family toxin [Kineosporiaceae bacterium]
MLRRRTPESLLRQLTGQVLAVTFVTVSELTKWTLLRSWGPARTASMEAFLDQLVILPYDSRVASTRGQLQAYAQLRGRPRLRGLAWLTLAERRDLADERAGTALGRGGCEVPIHRPARRIDARDTFA